MLRLCSLSRFVALTAGLVILCQSSLMAWQPESSLFSDPITSFSDDNARIFNSSFRLALANEDAFPDLVIMTGPFDGFQAKVAHGDDDGRFGEFVALGPSFSTAFTAFQWGDFDGNGFLDLAVLFFNTFDVFLNPGIEDTSITYAIPDGFGVAFAGPRMIAGDGDGDGDDDLFFLTTKTGSNGLPSSPVVAFLMDGGVQSEFYEADPDNGASIVGVGRYNNDEVADFWFNGGRVLLSQVGSSHQFLETDLSAPPNFDLNGDGLLDLLTANRNNTTVRWNQGNGQWSEDLSLPTAFNSVMGATDFNNDGNPDLYGRFPGSDSGVQLGEDGARYDDQIILSFNFFIGFMRHADLNQDGKIDLLITDQGLDQTAVFLNQTETVTLELPQIVEFSVSPKTIASGGEAQLSWSVEGASRVTITPAVGVVDAEGTRAVSVTQTTRFNLVAENETGQVEAQLTLAALTAPDFIKQDNYWLGDSGQLVCFYPDPGLDGAPGDLTYRVSFYVACELAFAPVIVDAGMGWPATLELDASLLPTGDYQIGVRRVPAENTELETAESLNNGPRAFAAPVAESGPESFSRWLMHIPKLAGGFASEIKIVNRNPSSGATLALWAFDQDGALLAVEERQVAASATNYHGIYAGQDPLFVNYTDAISHIALFERGNATRASLRYISKSSGFGAWTEEVDLSEGEALSSGFAIEARGAEAFADGLAVLNLLNSDELEARALQIDRDGNSLSEASLGTIPPGGKRLFVLSDLFPFQLDATYRIESLNGESFQIVALAFSGGVFFTTIPIDLQ